METFLTDFDPLTSELRFLLLRGRCDDGREEGDECLVLTENSANVYLLGN